MEKATKVANYTDEQTAEIKATLAPLMGDHEAQAAAIAVLAEKMQKSVRSLVAKASREQVYTPKTYTTKKGEKPVSKSAVAEAIGSILRLTTAEVDSLCSANKTALAKVFAALANSKPIDG